MCLSFDSPVCDYAQLLVGQKHLVKMLVSGTVRVERFDHRSFPGRLHATTKGQVC